MRALRVLGVRNAGRAAVGDVWLVKDAGALQGREAFQ